LKQAASRALLRAGLFLGLLVDLEDGGDIFLRTVVDLKRKARRYVAKERTLHNHRCENIKSYKIHTFVNKGVMHSLNMHFRHKSYNDSPVYFKV
jgi:hypothetical protein